jgi:hypothetical protein
MYALPVTLGAFALILVLTRLRVPLSAAILVGAVGAALAFGRPPAQVARLLLHGAVQPQAIALAVITVCLLALSGTMQATGRMEQIVVLARALFRRRSVTMAALPAIIGLLPMPGGALFSAPMVESAAGEGQASASKLSAVNYWFRHVWEYWWPLYPGVLLAMALTGRGFSEFAPAQLPLTVFMASSGLLLFRGAPAALRAPSGPAPPGAKRRVLAVTAPIWIVLLITAGGMVAAALLPAGTLPGEHGELIKRFAPILIGVLVALAWTTAATRPDRAALRKVWGARRLYEMTLLVIVVMAFQYVLGRVDAASRIAEELEAARVPAVIVVAVLPFIAGLVTGLAIGFVGTSFPIVLSLARAAPSLGPLPAYVALAYAFGHLGQMMSPLHVCHVVSNRYFGTSFGPVYRELLPSAAMTGALAAGYYVLLRLALG